MPAAATSAGEAHPRVSGENSQSAAAFAARQGSSPRERGKLTELLREYSGQRLIPA